MSDFKPKKFWTEVAVGAVDGGYEVTLDGRRVRTPAKAHLVVPTAALAQAIAAEWDAQGDQIDPETMPYTRSANAAIDKVTHQFAEVADMLAEYGDSDLLCYRADHPAELAARQAAIWDPLLDWAAGTLGAQLAPREGVMHAPQEAGALARLREQTHAFTPFELTAFHDLVAISGSLVIGFAAAHRFQSVDSLWNASRLDESWQIEQWGEDEEAAASEMVKKQSFSHAFAFFHDCHEK